MEMKRINRILGLLLLTLVVFSPARGFAAALSLTERGDSAYEADNFVLAEQLYISALESMERRRASTIISATHTIVREISEWPW